MSKRKNRANKADIQDAPESQLPSPFADSESGEEMMYGAGVNPAGRRAGNKRKSHRAED